MVNTNNKKKRYYIHGDQKERVLDKYYCTVCDSFEDKDHFYDRVHREYNQDRYLAALNRLRKGNKEFWRSCYRSANSYNLFSGSIVTKRESQFYRWLKKQQKRDDVIGDLAIDATNDKMFRIETSSFKKIKDYLIFKNACDEVIAALLEAFDEFKNKSHSNISLKLRFEILREDDYRCRICGASSKEARLEVDHKVPLSKGGTNDRSNLWTLCFKCNRGKGINKL